MAQTALSLHVGIKTDPVEYRYSYEWLLRLLAEEGIHHVQLGTFFEIYQLPDEFFVALRRQAEDFGLSISSIFTAHRELGGFFRSEPGWEQVARRNYERLIEVGALVGARSVGSSPGAVLRDQMGSKQKGIAVYIRHMKELMRYAHQKGVPSLCMEPMSCLAEPPTLPEEIRGMAEELLDFHEKHPDETSCVGLCADVTHGYMDRHGTVHWGNMQLLEAALPYVKEIHLKNTDARFESTFGFTEEDRKTGIVHLEEVEDLLLRKADVIPVRELVGYLEISGPKTGRDSTDAALERQLRESLRHARDVFCAEAAVESHGQISTPVSAPAKERKCPAESEVRITASLMCTDLCHFEESIRRLEACGVELLHFDIMDAHFVPNMPLGLEIIKQLRPKTSLPFDVHLMVANNDFFAQEIAEIGVQFISVHAESAVHLDRTLALIRERGTKAGVALSPATPLSALDPVLEQLDFVLLMTVNPGYAGQKMVPSSLRKIADCSAFLKEHGLNIPIMVDGNVSFDNIPVMVAAGADILVGGMSSVFHRDGSLQENVARTREAIARGLKTRNSHEA